MAELSPLRRRMIEDMTIQNMSPATQRSYISAVSKFGRYFGRSPDKLTLDDVHDFQVHLCPHPTRLVQPAAMASVAPPKPTYRPHLPARVVTRGLLSNAQLESVIYPGKAHAGHLAGVWTVDQSTARLITRCT